jgi:hypothetical protein
MLTQLLSDYLMSIDESAKILLDMTKSLYADYPHVFNLSLGMLDSKLETELKFLFSLVFKNKSQTFKIPKTGKGETDQILNYSGVRWDLGLHSPFARWSEQFVEELNDKKGLELYMNSSSWRSDTKIYCVDLNHLLIGYPKSIDRDRLGQFSELMDRVLAAKKNFADSRRGFLMFEPLGHGFCLYQNYNDVGIAKYDYKDSKNHNFSEESLEYRSHADLLDALHVELGTNGEPKTIKGCFSFSEDIPSEGIALNLNELPSALAKLELRRANLIKCLNGIFVDVKEITKPFRVLEKIKKSI